MGKLQCCHKRYVARPRDAIRVIQDDKTKKAFKPEET